MRLRSSAILVLCVLASLPACKRFSKKSKNTAFDAGAFDAGPTSLTSAAPPPDLPPPAAGKGQLTGTVTFAGAPVPNVEAKLCTKFTSLTVVEGTSGCTGAIFRSKSDANGRFVIGDLPPGTYEGLLVQVFDTSTYQYAHKLTDIFGATKQEITAGHTTDAGETKLVKSDILIAFPRSMMRVASTPTIRWVPYPRAASYTVRLRTDDRDARPNVEGTSSTPSFTPTAALAPGRWKLTIAALDKDGVKLAEDLDDRVFIVPDAEDKAPLDEAPTGEPTPTPPAPVRPELPALAAPADQGAVRGIVLFDDKPVPKIEVRLCETYDPFFSGCGGKILKAKTDAMGAYTFPAVAAKSWGGLTVKGLSGETLYMAGGVIGAKTFDVEAGKVLVPAVTNLTKADVKITSPSKKAKLAASRFPISWAAYPGATSYLFTLDAEDYDRVKSYKNLEIAATSFSLDKPLADGAYTVSIRALNANGTPISHSPSNAGAFVVKAK